MALVILLLVVLAFVLATIGLWENRMSRVAWAVFLLALLQLLAAIPRWPR